MSSFTFMGVIYKLKQEVIDFIVNEKRANPNLSCRKLADITQEKFQVEVSKSSINAIIKQASLSSPIGRRVGSLGKSKKFKIPQKKKKNFYLWPNRPCWNIKTSMIPKFPL